MALCVLLRAFLHLWHLILGISGPVIDELMEVVCKRALAWQISSRCLFLVVALSVLCFVWGCVAYKLRSILIDQILRVINH